MLDLKDVTLIMVDSLDYQRSKHVIKHCMSKANFADVKFLTHFRADDSFADKHVVNIQRIETKRQYSHFIIEHLNNYFTTNFVLLIQYDGFIIDETSWTDEFLEYDYIGAPWPFIVLEDGCPAHFNVGNGGFSLRSKKLQTILQKDINIIKNAHDDKAIGQINRPYLEYHCGIKYAPYHLAERFSFEYLAWLDRPIPKTFGGHNFFVNDNFEVRPGK